jgi:transcriptional regulator with XRE-family HTH domain
MEEKSRIRAMPRTKTQKPKPKPEPQPSTGERIRAVRTIRRMTQRDLAAEMALPQSVIARWESSPTQPSLRNLCRLAAALRCHMVELLPEGD